MTDFLLLLYPWSKIVHILAVISWMAGLLYLPRLFVNHVEHAADAPELAKVFNGMEVRLLRLIMNPAMIVTWVAGLCLAFTPGIVDWSEGYFHVKLVMVLGMTWFHHWLARRRKEFAQDRNRLTARRYRIMNEVPTLLMIVIVVMIVARPF